MKREGERMRETEPTRRRRKRNIRSKQRKERHLFLANINNAVFHPTSTTEFCKNARKTTLCSCTSVLALWDSNNKTPSFQVDNVLVFLGGQVFKLLETGGRGGGMNQGEKNPYACKNIIQGVT